MIDVTEGIFNIGDLVEVIDIGNGTKKWPWGEKKVSAIYLGVENHNNFFRYNLLKDLSERCSSRNKSHVVWYEGKKRYIVNDSDITLLASVNN